MREMKTIRRRKKRQKKKEKKEKTQYADTCGKDLLYDRLQKP